MFNDYSYASFVNVRRLKSHWISLCGKPDPFNQKCYSRFSQVDYLKPPQTFFDSQRRIDVMESGIDLGKSFVDTFGVKMFFSQLLVLEMSTLPCEPRCPLGLTQKKGIFRTDPLQPVPE